MPWIRIKDILSFSSNNGVLLQKGALDVSSDELREAVELAFKCMDEPYLRGACLSGTELIEGCDEIDFERYIALIKEFEIQDAGQAAKREHTKTRRSNFNVSRSQLILAMIEAGIPYVCAEAGCEIHKDLTIDHIVPLSRGGTDDLSNLRFLCLHHNSAKSDKLLVMKPCYDN